MMDSSAIINLNSPQNLNEKVVMNYIGLMQMSTGGYRRALDNCWSKGFDIVAVPISNTVDCRKDGYDFDPLDVSSNEFNYSFILMFSDHWLLPDRMLNTFTMQKEIDMCRYLQNRNCMLLRLRQEVNTQQAAMFSKLKGMLIIEIPSFNPNSMLPLGASATKRVAKTGETWLWWHSFNRKLDFNAHLHLIIELHPGIIPSSNAMCRWLSEPLEAVVLPREFFIVQLVTKNSENKLIVTVSSNKKKMLKQLFQHNVNMLVRASPNDPDLVHIVNYLREMRNKFRPLPLHPIGILTNRLHVPNTQVLSLWHKQINELFRSDTCKYKRYAMAVNQALVDFSKTPVPTRLENTFNILVVESTYAPIVNAVIAGALKSNCRVKIFCLSINYGFSFPKGIARGEQIDGKIQMFICNLQVKKLKTKLPVMDLIVSEQFAAIEEGNQMTPYTTFDLMTCLDPVTGLCIPNNVTVSLAPVMSARLYSSYRKLEKELIELNYHSTNSLPFPSRFVYELASPQLAYQIGYVYSLTESVCHRIYNRVYQNLLKFRMDKDLGCMLNAFRADYVVTLYKGITLSTFSNDELDPDVNTLSVMPIYFMFKEPITLEPGKEITVDFKRRISENKFWYEWGIQGHGTENCYGCACKLQHQSKLF